MPELKIKKQLPSSQQEKLAELWEDTDKQLAADRFPQQEEWTNAERQRGIPLDSNEVVRRVQKCNPFIWAEDSINCSGHISFYFVKYGHKTYTGAFLKKGIVFEYSRIYVDASDRPVAVEYGWREVLHRLSKQRLVTWGQIVKHFPIYSSARSAAFERQTRELRSDSC